MDTFINCIKDITEDQIIEDPRSVAQLFTFDIKNPQVAAIQSSLANFTPEEIEDKVRNVEFLGGTWRHMDIFIRSYILWCALVDHVYPEKCFEWYAKCFQALPMAYGNPKGACLNLLIKDLSNRMVNMFSNSGKYYVEYMSSVLIRLLTAVRGEREPISPNAPAKKDNVLFYANMLSRLYFKSDQFVSAGNIYSNMHSVGVVFSQFTMAEKVEYKYWVGRHAIFRCDVQDSYLNLQWALDHCLYPSPQYKLIWEWLLIPAILSGKLPTLEAIKAHPPSRGEVLEAISITSNIMKSGCYDEEKMRRLESNKWIISKNLWPLIQLHLPLRAHRRVMQRIHIYAKTQRIPFDLISRLLNIEDKKVLKTEGIIYALDNNGLITCNVLPQSLQCLLKASGSFPPLVDTTKPPSKDEKWLTQ